MYGACRGTQGSHFARRRCPSVIALRAKLRSVAISVPARPRGDSYAAKAAAAPLADSLYYYSRISAKEKARF